MKTVFLFVVVGLGLFSCRSKDNDEHVLIPGKGFDNVEIGRTTLQDLVRYYGNGLQIDTFFVHPVFNGLSIDPDSTTSGEIFSIKYSYSNLGLAFFFKPNDDRLESILLHAPFKGSTESGISLNKSTFKEVISKYGETKWSFTGDNIMKIYNGIYFSDNGYDSMTMTDEEFIKCLEKKVTEISIVTRKKKNSR